MKGLHKQIKRPFHFLNLYGQAINLERTQKIINFQERFNTKVITKW